MNHIIFVILTLLLFISCNKNNLSQQDLTTSSSSLRIFDGKSPSKVSSKQSSVEKSVGLLRLKGVSGRYHECNATLISSKFILTAAHCLYANGERNEIIEGDMRSHKQVLAQDAVYFPAYHEDSSKYSRVFIKRAYISRFFNPQLRLMDENLVEDMAILETENLYDQRDTGDYIGGHWLDIRRDDYEKEYSDQYQLKLVSLQIVKTTKVFNKLKQKCDAITYRELNTGNILKHKCDTIAGVSGAALLLKEPSEEKYRILGIHNKGVKYKNKTTRDMHANFGTKFSDQMYDDIQKIINNPKEQHDQKDLNILKEIKLKRTLTFNYYFKNDCGQEGQIKTQTHDSKGFYEVSSWTKVSPGQKIEIPSRTEQNLAIYFSLKHGSQSIEGSDFVSSIDGKKLGYFKRTNTGKKFGDETIRLSEYTNCSK